MAEILHALRHGSRCRRDVTPLSDDHAVLTRGDLVDRVAGLAGVLRDRPQRIGLLGSNGTEWAVAQLAAWFAGKTVVPMPAFFSRLQLEHLLKDAGIDHVVATHEAAGLAAALGLNVTLASAHATETLPEPSEGAGMIAYTSGSTGHPKGVHLGLEQIDWQARALAAAIGATSDDSYLSVLPLALVLETITAICVPLLVGARTHFATAVADSVGSGRPAGLSQAFDTWRPTTAVLVPQLLSAWIAELEADGKQAPDSLRFVAVGGAPIPDALSARAWKGGIPVHEGYGLTECCSVVAVNRPGRRKAGTAGEPLPGLDIAIEDGEIVVRGPTVMQGYLHGAPATGPWRTGDLGRLTRDGRLHVAGRKDTLIITASGRNISPEWVEAMVASDPRVAACVALGHGMDHVSVLLIPSLLGESWLMEEPRAHVLLWLEQVCIDAPSYAVPKDFVVCPAAQAKRLGLLTTNGRIVRDAALCTYPALRLARSRIAA
jgi:long-subunit acyl-CoA synthetase (AMP-forming)